MPQIFLRNRVVPSMPPSLVKFLSYDTSLMMAFFVSIPIRLHVPDDRYAKFSFAAGTAATALAVSCPATATTGIAPSPVSFCTSGRRFPIRSPGFTILPNLSCDSPTDASRLGSSCFVRGSSSCAVEAMVYSHTISPVSI